MMSAAAVQHRTSKQRTRQVATGCNRTTKRIAAELTFSAVGVDAIYLDVFSSQEIFP